MDKSIDIGEVELCFYVKVFGKAKADEIEKRIEAVRNELFQIEASFNSVNLLRMHITETRCI